MPNIYNNNELLIGVKRNYVQTSSFITMYKSYYLHWKGINVLFTSLQLYILYESSIFP